MKVIFLLHEFTPRIIDTNVIKNIIDKTLANINTPPIYVFEHSTEGTLISINCATTSSHKQGVRIAAQCLATLFQCNVYCNHSVAYLRDKQTLAYNANNLKPIYNITFGSKLKDVGSKKEE